MLYLCEYVVRASYLTLELLLHCATGHNDPDDDVISCLWVHTGRARYADFNSKCVILSTWWIIDFRSVHFGQDVVANTYANQNY